MSEKICGIYKITNKINGKCYIGQSVDIHSRWKKHIRLSNHNRCKGFYRIHYALRKYGLDNFTFEILEIVNKPFLNDREQYWVTVFQSADQAKGYNLTSGGDSNTELSNDVKNKMSVAHTGKVLSESHKKAIGNAHRGMKRSPETCENISLGNKGKPRLNARGKPSPMKGKHHSEETKRKLSEARKGKSRPTLKGKPLSEKHKEAIRKGHLTPESVQRKRESHLGQTAWNKGKSMSEEARKKMSIAKKGRPAQNKGIPRTNEQKKADREVAILRHLKKGNPCIRMEKDGQNFYFVSENDCVVSLGLTYSVISQIKLRLNGMPVSPKCRHKFLNECQFFYISQQEYLINNPELQIRMKAA